MPEEEEQPTNEESEEQEPQLDPEDIEGLFDDEENEDEQQDSENYSEDDSSEEPEQPKQPEERQSPETEAQEPEGVEPSEQTEESNTAESEELENSPSETDSDAPKLEPEHIEEEPSTQEATPVEDVEELEQAPTNQVNEQIPGDSEPGTSPSTDRDYLKQQDQANTSNLPDNLRAGAEKAGEEGVADTTAGAAEEIGAGLAAGAETAVVGEAVGAAALEATAGAGAAVAAETGAAALSGPVGWVVGAGILLKEAVPFIKKYRWPIFWANILILGGVAMFALVLGSILNRRLGDIPSKIAVASSSIFGTTYCDGMQTTLDSKRTDGSIAHLTLYATQGEYSMEKAYDDEKSASGLSLDSYNSQDPSSPHYFPASWKPYYASGRWGYSASAFDTAPVGWTRTNAIFPGIAKGGDYATRRVIFYNPANGKAAVAIIVDWGPNTGVYQDRSKSNLDKQRDLWNGEGSSGGYRITNPDNDPQALIGGGPATLAQEIGADQYTPIIMGFATDQTLDPTKPFVCKVEKGSLTTTTSPSPTVSPSLNTGAK